MLLATDSEPLWAALNATKNKTFVSCCADQLYRLGSTRSGPGQIAAARSALAQGNAASLRIVAVPPLGGWRAAGRLRLLNTGPIDKSLKLTVSLNGHALEPTPNTSSLFDEGAQATKGILPPGNWAAFDVPASILVSGNNSVAIVAKGGGGERGYTLTHTGKAGDSKRWRFPYPHTSATYHGAKVNGSEAAPGLGLSGCEAACDKEPACKGIYFGSTCYLLHDLVVAHTTLDGASYTRSSATAQTADGAPSGFMLDRLELAVPVRE